MRGSRALTRPGAELGLPARIGLSVAVLFTAYRLALNQQLVYLLGTAVTIGVLAMVPVEVFLGVMLLARNVADTFADTYVPGGGALNIGALVGILAICVGCLRLIGIRHIEGLGFGLLFLVLLFVWTLVGYANYGIDNSITREFIRTASIVVLGLVASVFVRRLADVDRVVAAVVLAALVPAIIAIGQWVSSGDVTTRVAGTFAHPNAAAGVFGVALAIALWKLLQRWSPAYAGAAILFAVALLATRSLGGLAQIFVTLLVYSILTRRSGSRPMVTAIAGVAILAVFSLTPLGRDRIEEVQTTRSFTAAVQGDQTNSLDWRFANWAKLLESWRDRPVLGHGSGTTATLVAPGLNIPHSDVIRLIVETGVLGFLLFGGAFIALLVGLYRRARAPADTASFAAAVLAIVAGLAVHGLVNNVSTQTATMYALAILLGAAVGVTRPAEDPRRLRAGEPQGNAA